MDLIKKQIADATFQRDFAQANAVFKRSSGVESSTVSFWSRS